VVLLLVAHNRSREAQVNPMANLLASMLTSAALTISLATLILMVVGPGHP
jgi:hypothetical protein